MKILYFAWLRERTGLAEEEIAPPDGVETVGDLITWIQGRGENFAHAFETPEAIRVAVDREHRPASAPIAGASEIAFFPPMTGG